MKLTKNRTLILQALAESNEYDKPPYSASSIRYTLENAFNYKWQGYDMKTLPSIIQIHRTLKDLWHGGAIVGTRVKDDGGFNGSLPCWVIRYQLSGDVEKNYIVSECQALHRKVSKAKHGTNLFGGVFDMGLPENDVKQLTIRVKSLMQKTHPDKATGFESEFKQLKDALDLIKSGIPKPTPTFTAADSSNFQKQLA